MAEIVGPQTILAKALPTGWDGTRLAEWALRDGITYGQYVNQVALAMADFNQEMVNQWGWLMYPTEEIAMEYEDGGSVTAAPDITDVDNVDSIGGSTIGHMIDLRVYGGAIGGTRRYFRDARSAKLDTAITTQVRRLKWRFEQKLLTRWFVNTENTIGSAGYDVPFVRGTGGTVDFAPPAFDGEAFTTSHNHYLGVDDDSLSPADSLNQMAETLQEHGHEPPYTAMVARADISSYYALTGFVELVDTVVSAIDRGGVTSGNEFFARGQRQYGMIGYFQSEYGLIELRASSRVPTLYAGLAKSYGNLDSRNPLAVRVHPDVGFGAYIVPETTADDDYPIKKMNIEMEFGVGVGIDRTNGAASYLISGGSWVNPTIS